MKDRTPEIIAEQFNVKVEDLDEGTNFVDDLNVDSIEFLEPVMTIEDKFDLELEDEVLENLTIVGDVIDCVDAQDLDEQV